MNLTVEVDASDLPDLTYYRDERCQDIEGMLRETSEYTDCVVKRCHQPSEFQEYGDPFAIQDSEEEILAWIYEWEVNALNKPELIALIGVRSERGKISDSAIPLQFGGGFAVFFGICMVGAQLILSLMGNAPPVEIFFVPGVLLVFIGLIVFFVGSRRDRGRKKELDIETAKSDPSFLSALRKLASIADTEYKDAGEFAERLRKVEKEIM